MRNKYIPFALLLAASSLISSCKLNREIDPNNPLGRERFDFDKASVQLMDTVVEDLRGSWNLSQVEFDIKYPPANGSVKKDTVYKDFAVLEIQSIERDETLRYPHVRGQLQFRDRIYPVQFRMISNPERLVDKKGPQAFMLFEYAFPDGSRVWETEELFFRDSGLMSENYSIEINAKTRQMIWKGLNRDIKQVVLKRL